MSLENLSKIGRLEPHQTDAAQLGMLLESASRKLADAESEAISLETRFDAAYGCIMQLCMSALWANGYRTSKRQPGHHQTMIQSLVHTIDLDADQMRLLETFRIKRNVIDYSGDLVDEHSVAECIAAASALQTNVMRWLSAHRADLTSK